MRWRLAETVACCLALAAFAPDAEADPAPPQAEPGAAADQLLLLDVSVNGQDRDEISTLLLRRGVLYARVSDLRLWRIRQTGAAVVKVEDEFYLPLTSLPGVTATVDEARQMLRLTVAADAFESSSISPEKSAPAITASVPAAFVNYDMSFEQSGGAGTATAFVQAGVSDSWGLVTNTMAVGEGEGVHSTVRLDTTYQFDDPAHLTRLSIGDAITRGSDWIQPVRFAGIRYGTEFDLQPNLITFPTPTFFGRTSLPSTVELYVNDVMRFRGDVDPGPFSLNQVPLVTGAGQVALTVRDALGVERQTTSSYYISSSLLKPGLTDFSIEAGTERQAYGLKDFDYSDPFVAGTYRWGVTNRATLQGRVEAGSRVQDIGGGATLLWPAVGQFDMAVAASNAPEGQGGLVRVGFSRLTPHWNVAAVYQHATPNFRQIGDEGPDGDEQIRDQLQLSAGLSFGRFGDISAAYTRLRLGDTPLTRIGSLNYSLPVAGRAYFSAFLLYSQAQGTPNGATAGVSVTIPFGRRSSAYAQAANGLASAEVRTTPPTDHGWGYRLSESTGDQDRQEADLTYHSQAGDFTAEAANASGQPDVRFLASGGLVMIGGKVLPTRQLNGGFALVETPASAGVNILEENRPVARTDAQGLAVITDLRPYERNKISLDVGDLPIQAGLESDVLEVTPRFLGATRARFAISTDQPANLVVHLPGGEPVEAGTPVEADAGAHLFVGYGGEVFVPSIHAGEVFTLRRREGPCQVVAPAVAKAEAIPRLGPLTCKPSEHRP